MESVRNSWVLVIISGNAYAMQILSFIVVQKNIRVSMRINSLLLLFSVAVFCKKYRRENNTFTTLKEFSYSVGVLFYITYLVLTFINLPSPILFIMLGYDFMTLPYVMNVINRVYKHITRENQNQLPVSV